MRKINMNFFIEKIFPERPFRSIIAFDKFLNELLLRCAIANFMTCSIDLGTPDFANDICALDFVV